MMTVTYYIMQVCKTCEIHKNIHNSAYVFELDELRVVVDIKSKDIYIMCYPKALFDLSVRTKNEHLFDTVVRTYVEQHAHEYVKHFYLNQKMKEDDFFNNNSIINSINNSINNDLEKAGNPVVF